MDILTIIFAAFVHLGLFGAVIAVFLVLVRVVKLVQQEQEIGGGNVANIIHERRVYAEAATWHDGKQSSYFNNDGALVRVRKGNCAGVQVLEHQITNFVRAKQRGRISEAMLRAWSTGTRSLVAEGDKR